MKNSINKAFNGGLESDSIGYVGVASAVSATGCGGANSYLAYAKASGFRYVEVLNWCSSAGDWQFIVSKTGKVWRVLSQENNYPQHGFSHSLSKEKFYGTAEQVIAQILSAP